MLYVLGFGSRGWTDDHWVGVVLADIGRSYEGEIRLLHGDCPSGADRMCGAAAAALGWRVKAMPADWNRLKRRAGHVRNREMSELLFDRRERGHEVMARGFSSSWPKLTPGTTGMAELLDAAHIPYRLYGPTGEADAFHELGEHDSNVHLPSSKPGVLPLDDPRKNGEDPEGVPSGSTPP